jgi:hypothetical protein
MLLRPQRESKRPLNETHLALLDAILGSGNQDTQVLTAHTNIISLGPRRAGIFARKIEDVGMVQFQVHNKVLRRSCFLWRAWCRRTGDDSAQGDGASGVGGMDFDEILYIWFRVSQYSWKPGFADFI